MELEWLKKVRAELLSQRQTWVSIDDKLSVVAQCQLAGIARSMVYVGKAEDVDEFELLLLRLLDEEYTRHPILFGLQIVVVWLGNQGYTVNRKRVQRLMRILGLVAMAPGPNTSKRHPEHTVYPYLLRGLDIVRPNQVWSTDITVRSISAWFCVLQRDY